MSSFLHEGTSGGGFADGGSDSADADSGQIEARGINAIVTMSPREGLMYGGRGGCLCHRDDVCMRRVYRSMHYK